MVWLKRTVVSIIGLGWCESCQSDSGVDQTTGLRPLEKEGLIETCRCSVQNNIKQRKTAKAHFNKSLLILLDCKSTACYEQLHNRYTGQKKNPFYTLMLLNRPKLKHLNCLFLPCLVNLVCLCCSSKALRGKCIE